MAPHGRSLHGTISRISLDTDKIVDNPEEKIWEAREIGILREETRTLYESFVSVKNYGRTVGISSSHLARMRHYT